MAIHLGHHADRTFTYPAARSKAIEEAVQTPWLAAARAIFGGYFLFNGINHFMNLTMMSAYAASKGVPFPEAALMLTGLTLLLGGVSLILGLSPRIGAGLIMLFLLGVTPVMHDFWNMTDPQARMNEFVNFGKNVALIGGACFAIALREPWPAALRLGRPTSQPTG